MARKAHLGHLLLVQVKHLPRAGGSDLLVSQVAGMSAVTTVACQHKDHLQEGHEAWLRASLATFFRCARQDWREGGGAQGEPLPLSGLRRCICRMGTIRIPTPWGPGLRQVKGVALDQEHFRCSINGSRYEISSKERNGNQLAPSSAWGPQSEKNPGEWSSFQMGDHRPEKLFPAHESFTRGGHTGGGPFPLPRAHPSPSPGCESEKQSPSRESAPEAEGKGRSASQRREQRRRQEEDGLPRL